jgi:hypothetical protein
MIKRIFSIILTIAIITFALSYLILSRLTDQNQWILAKITGIETFIFSLFGLIFFILLNIKPYRDKKFYYSIRRAKFLGIFSSFTMGLGYFWYIFLGISASTHATSSMGFDLATTSTILSMVFNYILALHLIESNKK